jgi:uncharacterized protein (UPF0335 family)
MEVRTRRELLSRVQELEKENKNLKKNPVRTNPVAAGSKREMLERIEQLEEENQNLQAQLAEIADIVTIPEEEGE